MCLIEVIYVYLSDLERIDGVSSRSMSPVTATTSILPYLSSLQVKEFQPLYVWNERKGEELRIGAQMLQEAIDLAEQKSVRSRRNAAEAKAAAEAATKNVRDNH